MNATTLETPLWNSSDSTDARPIILTFLDWTRDKDPRVPLAMASLMAALREAEVPAKALSFPVNDQRFERQQVFQTLSRLLAAHPGAALGFGVYVWSEASIQHLGRRLRWRFPHRPFVLGGPQISYSNSGLEKRYPFGSAFIRGYGEDALVRVLTSSLGTSIPGVQWAGPGLNPSDSTASVNLEKLPSPFLDGSIDLDGQQFIRWETQRGCAFNCSFCQHREAGRKLTDRNLNHGRLKEEIRLFAASSVSDIAVLDPIFNSNASTSNHIAILKEFRRQGFGGKLSLQCRFEFVTEEFLQQVKHLNCTLEFGLQTIHRQEGKAVRRPNNMDAVDTVIDRLHELGIHFEVSLIFGLPLQTLNSFRDSVA